MLLYIFRAWYGQVDMASFPPLKRLTRLQVPRRNTRQKNGLLGTRVSSGRIPGRGPALAPKEFALDFPPSKLHPQHLNPLGFHSKLLHCLPLGCLFSTAATLPQRPLPMPLQLAPQAAELHSGPAPRGAARAPHGARRARRLRRAAAARRAGREPQRRGAVRAAGRRAGRAERGDGSLGEGRPGLES